MFAKVENGVTKSCQNKLLEKQKKRNFGLKFSPFLQQDSLLFARVEIGVTEYPTKTAKKEEEEEKNVSEIFFKSGRAHPVFNREFSSFWPRKT